MIRNKIEFEVEGTKFAVVKPAALVRTAADIVHSKAFKEALVGGAILRERVATALAEQGLLTEEKRREIETVQERLEKNLRKVPDEKGRVKEKGVTAEQAKEAAVLVRADRLLLRLLNADRIALESHTVEGLAENARFDFLVSKCTLTADGNPVFDSVDDYRDRDDRGDPVARQAGRNFGYLYHGLDPDYEAKLPENAYLEKVGYFTPQPEAPAEETFELTPDPAPASPDDSPAGQIAEPAPPQTA